MCSIIKCKYRGHELVSWELRKGLCNAGKKSRGGLEIKQQKREGIYEKSKQYLAIYSVYRPHPQITVTARNSRLARHRFSRSQNWQKAKPKQLKNAIAF